MLAQYIGKDGSSSEGIWILAPEKHCKYYENIAHDRVVDEVKWGPK